VPCDDPEFGFYIGDGCYWKAYDPQPVDHPPPGGQDPKDGRWGVKSCYLAPGSTRVTQLNYWLENPTTGPTPNELAQHALAKIHLSGAEIGTASKSKVGLPVWLWTAVTPSTWGPLSASASGGGVTVNVTAKATSIVWDMGDGTRVTCANPGTAYAASYGAASSPSCGYTYAVPSSTADHPHDRYTITATTYWSVTWAGGGESGTLTPTSQAQTSVEIGEIQVVNVS
jgi:hypothetical protein